MVGPPRGPSRPTMTPQPRVSPASLPPQPQQQFIFKQVTPPYTVLPKTQPAPNYVNYLSLPMMPGNGSFLTVTSKPAETNGTTFLTMPSRPGFLVTKPNDNNNTAPFIPTVAGVSPHAHQYLIPKPEPFAMHNYSKNEPGVSKRKPVAVATRPTNHQRIKEEEEEEGEEVRPVLDPNRPLADQLVQMDHSYPQWLLPQPPQQDDDKESTISMDEKPDHNDEGEETETAAEGEDSITRCICNLEHDDGYMISCDKCYVWQHVACVLPDTPLSNSAEMTYLCDICEPRVLDHNRARALQLQRCKQILKRHDSSDDSWSSIDRTAPTPKKAVARRRPEPIPRRPSKSKADPLDSPIRLKSKSVPNDTHTLPKNKRSEVDGPVRSKLLKAGKRGRRDSVKATPPTPPVQPSLQPTSVGRRTKLKRKFENKANLRRKSKSKESDNVEKEEERPKSIELRTRQPVERAPAKSKCRLSHSAMGEPIVVATCRVSVGELLTELRGKYLQSPTAAPRADVLFHYKFPRDGTEVTLDGSGRENVVRYARRSCMPNARFKHILEKGSLRIFLVALGTIERSQEVIVPHGSVTDNAVNSIESCGKECKLSSMHSPNSASVDRRRRSRRRTVSEESDGSPIKREGRPPSPLSPTSERKMTREEKKIEQAMKIFAQMERESARKRDKGPGSGGMSYRRGPDSDKESPVDPGKSKRRRRRRRRRSCRKTRLTSGSGTGLSQLVSGDETDVSSGDDLASPRDKNDSKDSGREDDDEKIVGMNDAAGLLLALGGARRNTMSGRHTPPPTARDTSENDSSPTTPVSSTCLLVAAAVGPLAPGFKFPKTKKGMMNAWLGKSPEHVPSSEPLVSNSDMTLPPGAPKLANLSNRLYYPPREAATPSVGFGKKRWLRQAISEETETPLGSPPLPPDNGTPLKKRRLARESLNSEPPTTPPLGQTPSHHGEDMSYGGESPSSGVGAGDLAERVRLMQREYMANQGIEYDTSPQRVAENLTLPRTDDSPDYPDEAPSLRKGRKQRTPQRGKRKMRRSDRSEESESRTEPESESTPEKLPEVSLIKDEQVPVDVKTEPLCSPVDLPIKSEPPAAEPSPEESLLVKSEPQSFPEEVKDVTLPADVSLHPPELSSHPVSPSGDLVEQDADTDVTPVPLMPSLEKTNSDDSPVALESQSEIAPPLLKEEMTPLTRSRDPRERGPPELKPQVTLSEEDKAAPIKRKLSITEYLKRKKGRKDGDSSDDKPPSLTKMDDEKDRPPSPSSDDDISPLLLPTPTLPLPFLDGPGKGGRLKFEPTELERQRENLNERLRREFGLMISDDEARTTTPEPTAVETNGFPETKLAFPVVQTLPQSAIYPVGSSNPPNPFSPPFPLSERRKFRK